MQFLSRVFEYIMMAIVDKQRGYLFLSKDSLVGAYLDPDAIFSIHMAAAGKINILLICYKPHLPNHKKLLNGSIF